MKYESSAGSNYSGELGDGTTTDSLVPVRAITAAGKWCGS
jgi:hypothetical protein